MINYFWEFGDGEISYEETPSHTYNYPGKYTVSLTVWDDADDIQNKVTKLLYIYVYTIDQLPRKTNKCYGFFVNEQNKEE